MRGAKDNGKPLDLTAKAIDMSSSYVAKHDSTVDLYQPHCVACGWVGDIADQFGHTGHSHTDALAALNSHLAHHGKLVAVRVVRSVTIRETDITQRMPVSMENGD